ncbi:hypothetical protein MMC2321_02478 [Chitinophaga sp. MM2321]
MKTTPSNDNVQGYIYDTDALTFEKISGPKYLKYQLAPFNTKTQTWYEENIDFPNDFSDDKNDANLFVTETCKIHASGIKNNNGLI